MYLCSLMCKNYTEVIHYLQWLYACRRETNVIYHYSNIDPCEAIKVYDYMYAKRKNQ